MNLNPEDVTPVTSIFPISKVYYDEDEADYNPLKYRAFILRLGSALYPNYRYDKLVCKGCKRKRKRSSKKGYKFRESANRRNRNLQ